jgi:phage shock protein A
MKQIHETMSGLKDQSAFETFDRMATKIDQIEAEAEAGAELSEEYSGDVLKSKFSQLEATSGADLELEELKRRMGVSPPAQAAVAARVEVADEAEPSAEELAELDAALEALKQREARG